MKQTQTMSVLRSKHQRERAFFDHRTDKVEPSLLRAFPKLKTTLNKQG